jgi:hypothetical protein
MPVLLLCQGDDQAKAWLRRGIERLYGPTPPLIEGLHVHLTGHALGHVGPLPTRTPVEMTATRCEDGRLRLDLAHKPRGRQARLTIEAFDGQTYRLAQGDETTVHPGGLYATSLRRRLWAMQALTLTPLGAPELMLSTIKTKEVSVRHRETEDEMLVEFREDGDVARVAIECTHPMSGTAQIFSLEPASQVLRQDGMAYPAGLRMIWDRQPMLELTTQTIDQDPETGDAYYRPE